MMLYIAIVATALLTGPVIWFLWGLHSYRKAVREGEHAETSSEAGLW